jgi:hypothetical protein
MEKPVRTAGAVRIDHLYHYQPFNADRLPQIFFSAS